MTTAVVAGVGYAAYDTYRAGYHTRPEMPNGAFSISYKNGLRAILIGVPNEQNTRRYLGIPANTPFYLKDAWSYCHPPAGEEVAHAVTFVEGQDWPGARFEAICRVTIDGKATDTGLIVSVPKL